MHILVAFITVLTVGLSFFNYVYVIKQGYKRPQKSMLMIASCNSFLAIGNMVSVFGYGTSGSYSGYIVASAGGVFVCLCVLIMFCEVFREKLSFAFEYINIAIGLMFFIAIVIDRKTHFVFESYVVDTSGLVAERSIVRGLGFMLFKCWQIVILLALLYHLYKCKKTRPKYFESMKRHMFEMIAIIFVACGITSLAFLFDNKYDFLAFGSNIALGMVIVFLNRRNNLNQVNKNFEASMLQAFDDPMIAFDTQMRLVYVNSAAREILHIDNDYSFDVPIYGRSTVFDSIVGLENGSNVTIEESIFLLNRAKISGDSDKIITVLWLHDITNNNQSTEILSESKERVEAGNVLKGLFLANMSNEIRNPLNIMLGMDEMILRENWDENISDYAVNIMRAGRTLVSVLNDIYDYSRIEAGAYPAKMKEYSLPQMISDLAMMVRFSAEKKNLRLIVDVDRNLNVKYVGDETKIRQVILNALTNAVKYTNEGSITLHVFAENDVAGQPVLAIDVTDTGVGIPKDKISQILNIDPDKSDEYFAESSGIGMSISRRLVEIMNGTISIDSEFGKGTRVFIRIPQKSSAETAKIGVFRENDFEVRTEENDRVRFIAPDARILVVDDNGVNRALEKALLKETKIVVHEVDSGERCLEAIKNETYDLIIMDHRMPGLSGVDTLELMKKDKTHLCQDVPVIIMTADVGEGRKAFFLNKGFVDYLSKPVNPAEYEKMVMKYIPRDKVSMK